MKVLFVGSVEMSEIAIKGLLSLHGNEIEVVGILSKESSQFNADHKSLIPLAIEAKIPYYTYKKETETGLISWIKERKADVLFCVGWSHILPSELISLFPLGGIG